LLLFPKFFLTVLHCEMKRMLSISNLFLFLVSWSQLQLRRTSKIYQFLVIFEGSRAGGYWNVAYSRPPTPRCPSPPRKVRRKADL